MDQESMLAAGHGTSPTISARLEVVRCEDQHADLLAHFIRKVWDPHATSASVRAARAADAERNVVEPGVAPPTWIAVQNGSALGYVTTIPIRLWDGRRQWPAYWIKGLMVLPEYRGGPIGYLLLKAAAGSLSRSGGLAVAAAARRLFEAVGYRDLGAVPNWVRPIAPHEILNRIDPRQLGLAAPGWLEKALQIGRRTGMTAVGGWAAGAVLRFAAGMDRAGTATLQSGPLDSARASSALDALWSASSRTLRSCVVRDGRYLIDRYPSGPGHPYVWLGTWRGRELAGAAVLRRPRESGDERLRGIRVATLTDLLYRPERPDDGLALLGQVERAARSLGAHAILASTSSGDLTALLRRQLYFSLTGNVHLLFRDTSDDSPAFGQTVAEWFIMRGDGQADETF
jgi:GNAT superfamily N-acetyltransferase